MAELKVVYDKYVGRTEGGMDGRTFVKLLKDTGIIDKTYTTTDGDLTFVKMKPKTSKYINFHEFEKALAYIAEKKNVDVDVIEAAAIRSDGPTFSGTHAAAVPLHDDKTLYTGVHAHGGPEVVDPDRVGGMFSNIEGGIATGVRPARLEEITDRAPTDVRGVKGTHN